MVNERQGGYARERAAQLRNRNCPGRTANQRKGDIPFARYVDDIWFPNHLVELNTRQNYRGHLNRYILPEFGAKRVREITPTEVRAFVAKLQTAGTRRSSARS